MKKTLKESIGIGIDNESTQKLEHVDSKNGQIQCLRALFCFLILFYHFTVRYYELYNVDNIFRSYVVECFSHVGISSFFILSGYFLIRRSSNEKKPLKSKILYWLRRFLNVYLPFVFAVLVIYLFSFTGLLGESRTASFLDFIQNVVFLNYITGAKSVDGSHWYVFSLMCCFLLSFIYDLIPLEEDRKYFYWISLLFISLFSSCCLKYLDLGSGLNKLFKAVDLFLCRGYFTYVFIGVFMFLFNEDKMVCRKNLFLSISFIVELFFLAVFNWLYLLLSLSSLVLIFLAITRKMRFLDRAKPLIIFGNASFSIYLLHQNIGFMLLIFLSQTIGYYVALCIAICVVLFIGFSFYLFAEKPYRALGRDRQLRDRRQRRQHDPQRDRQRPARDPERQRRATHLRQRQNGGEIL